MKAHLVRVAGCLGIAAALAAAGCTRKPERTKQDWIVEGDRLLQEKQYRRAAEAYQRATLLDPKDPVLRQDVAETFEMGGLLPQAMREAINAADLDPNNLDIQMMAARLMVGQGRFFDASSRLEALIRKDPNNMAAVMLLANATAHLASSGIAVFELAPFVPERERFEARRREVRPGTARSDDVAAEKLFRSVLEKSPDDFETQLAFVNFLWACGRLDESEEWLRRAADQNPQHGTANFALGQFYRARQRTSEAEHYLKLAASAPGSFGTSPRLALVEMYMAAERLQDARGIVTAMKEQGDPLATVMLLMTQIDLRTDDRALALTHLDELLSKEPRQPDALVLKAQVLYDMGRVDEAEPLARSAVDAAPNSGGARAILGRILFTKDRVNDAFTELSEALRLDPDADGVPLLLAKLALKLERGVEAAHFAREARRQHPGTEATLTLAEALVMTEDLAGASAALRSQRADALNVDALVLLGNVQAASYELAAARATYERALRIEPGSLPVFAALVELDLRAGDVESARRRLDQAPSDHRQQPRFLRVAAQVHAARGDSVSAERMLRDALAQEPANVDAAVMLAQLYGSQKRHDESRRTLEDVLKHRPQSLTAMTELAIQLESAGDVSGAIARYQDIVARYPRAALPARRLALLFADRKENLEVALNLAVAAKQIRPRDPAVSDTLGWVFVQKGMHERAMTDLQDAVRQDPRNPIYRYHLGVALIRANLPRRARPELQEALRLDPQFAHADEARAALAGIP